MKRTSFIVSTIAGVVVLGEGAGATQVPLGPPTPYGIPTRVYVARPTVIPQQCAEWCWAASSAMIFACFGHPIDQSVIVQTVYGAVVCVAAQHSTTIGSVLSSTWTDKTGTSFSSTVTAAYDSANLIYGLDNNIIVNELANNRPLLYANTHHAMVVVSMDYMQTPAGVGQVLAVGVLDPWPASLGFHLLSAGEVVPDQSGGYMTFLAAVQVV
jgi:hypothetical protein